MRLPAPVPLELQGRVFTRDDALAAGVTSRTLDGRAYVRIFPCVYAPRGLALTQRHQIEAALLASPVHAYASHVSCFQLLGLDIGARKPVHLSTAYELHLAIPGIRLHEVTRLPPCCGRSMVAPAAFVGAGLQLDLVHLVAAGDWLVAERHTTLADFGAYVDTVFGVHGIKAARRALGLVREGAESVRESYVRVMLVLAGLEEPQLNRCVYDRGRFVARVDMVWFAYGVVVEYDGRQHVERIEQWERDMARLPEIEDLGLVTVRISNMALRRPRDVVWRIYRKLVAGGYTGPPPVFDAEWMRLFEHKIRA